jgi:hypothetical protein
MIPAFQYNLSLQTVYPWSVVLLVARDAQIDAQWSHQVHKVRYVEKMLLDGGAATARAHAYLCEFSAQTLSHSLEGLTVHTYRAIPRASH